MSNALRAFFKHHFYVILAIIFTLLVVIHAVLAFVGNYPIMLFWYCYALVVVFTLGLWLKNNFLISTTVVGSFVINFLWLQDFLSLVFFKKLSVGLYTYLFGMTVASFFMTFYHGVMLFLSLYVLFKQEKVHTYAWAGAGITLLIISIFTYLSGHVDVNCVKGTCDLGIFEPLTFLYSLSVYPFFINVLFMTVVIFIPTTIVLKLVFRWVFADTQKKD